MFYSSGENIKVEIRYIEDDRRYRITAQGISSPVKYLGNVKIESLQGEVFLDNNEAIIVNLNNSVEYALNEILTHYSQYDQNKNHYELTGVVVGNLDLEHFYKQIEEKFIVEATRKAEYKLNWQINYAKKYDEEVTKNKKYQNLIKNYIDIQSTLPELIKRFNSI